MSKLSIADADQKMHPVEIQWHYPIMTKYGFNSDTPPQKGFVRHYQYSHPDGRLIKVTTGISADYFEDDKGAFGYPGGLEPHLARSK